MATTQIKDYANDNQAHVDNTGHVYITDGGQPIAVTGSITATNPSVGTNGTTAPTSSTQVGAVNSSGDLVALKVDSSGALLVDASTTFQTETVVVGFNNVNSVVVGVETTINTFTASTGFLTFMLTISVSGGNRAQYNVYNNGVLLDTLYTPVTNLSGLFDYKTEVSSSPGYVVNVGNVINVTVINNGTDAANFNARFLILETT